MGVLEPSPGLRTLIRVLLVVAFTVLLLAGLLATTVTIFDAIIEDAIEDTTHPNTNSPTTGPGGTNPHQAPTHCYKTNPRQTTTIPPASDVLPSRVGHYIERVARGENANTFYQVTILYTHSGDSHG